MAALAVAAGTGIASFSVGISSGRWVIVVHGVIGISVIVLTPWKTPIARRGLRVARPGKWLGVALAMVIAVVVMTGFLFSTGLVLSYGPVSAMQLHVGAALAGTLAVLAHVRVRPVSVRRLDLGRREALRSGGVAAVGAAAWLALERLAGAAGWPGADRRFTGSHERGSGDPAQMPVTQWFNDSVQIIHSGSWVLAVRDPYGTRTVSYADLDRGSARLTATLDCTGGWFAIQDWEGVWLDSVVRAASDQSIVVRSATGYARRFPGGDAGNLLLATRVGGEPLSEGHGYPLRLVAPGRRGFWWVKWITEIAVDDRPWWIQSPFPLE